MPGQEKRSGVTPKKKPPPIRGEAVGGGRRVGLRVDRPTLVSSSFLFFILAAAVGSGDPGKDPLENLRDLPEPKGLCSPFSNKIRAKGAGRRRRKS